MPGSRFRRGIAYERRKSLRQLARERLGAKPDEQVENDSIYTARAHLPGGPEAEKEIRRGRAAHLFRPDVDLEQIEREVWERGHEAPGVIRGFRRFWAEFHEPVGDRSRLGKPSIPLRFAEVKVKLDGKIWKYHLVPRASPAKEKK